MSSEYVIYCTNDNRYGKIVNKMLCKTHSKEYADLIVDALSRLEDSADVNYFYKIEKSFHSGNNMDHLGLGCGA